MGIITVILTSISSIPISSLAFNWQDNICLSGIQKHNKALPSSLGKGQEVPQMPNGVSMLRMTCSRHEQRVQLQDLWRSEATRRAIIG